LKRRIDVSHVRSDDFPPKLPMLSRAAKGLLDSLLRELAVAQLRQRVAQQVGPVALDFREARVGYGRRRHGVSGPEMLLENPPPEP
jgi:hypothetical protein